jgi:hypothetical protein
MVATLPSQVNQFSDRGKMASNLKGERGQESGAYFKPSGR